MNNTKKKLQIGVIGYAGKNEYKVGGGPTVSSLDLAEEIGFLLASKNITVVTGGKGGIMESASKGAKRGGGTTVGVVKGRKRFTSNKFIDVEVITGMEADGMDELNLVLMCDAFIVIGGGAGTLQEMAIAYRNMKPIVVLEGTNGWSEKLANQYLDERKRMKIESGRTPKECVDKALRLIK